MKLSGQGFQRADAKLFIQGFSVACPVITIIQFSITTATTITPNS